MTDENRLNSIVDEINDGKSLEVLAEHEAPPINRTALNEAMEALNRNYFVAKVGGNTFVFDERERPLLANAMKFEAFAQFMAPHRIGSHEVARKWLKWPGRRNYDSIVFDPSNSNPPNTYNTWRGLAVTPRKGKCRLIKEHIHNVWCSGNDDQFIYTIKWFALLAQQPWVKPEVALVLPAVEGAGKNIIIGILLEIFGEHAFTTAQKEQIAGRFTGHLFDKVLVVPDEALFAGDPAAVAVVRALVTNKVFGYEGKGKAALTALNYGHFIIPTNSGWAVHAGSDARRWMVLDVSEARKGDLAYFESLAAEIENGGVAAFLHRLLQVDLTGFNPRAFPISKALSAQRTQTMERTDPVGAFLMQALAAGEFHTTQGMTIPWPAGAQKDREIASYNLQDCYTAATARARVQPPGFAEAMKRLRALLPQGALRQKKRRQGRDRTRYYQLPSLKAARAHFQRVTGIELYIL